ncbi:MAG: glycosyltransferase [Acidobacteria bacterium]|nr:glycosyltransferase [Acidobacteriota bacterium]MBA3888752.1 glycosyltransferase [Acidobacteriota bacterium]
MKIVVLGLSITSSWGNGHATTYRALVRALAARGHSVLFLERDVEWYAQHRDLPNPSYCAVRLYDSLEALEERHVADLRAADLVMLGSYVPDGIAVGDFVLRVAGGVTAFYDIDTPVTLSRLAAGGAEYLAPRQIPHFDLYLSFAGGPALVTLQNMYGARRARPLYCSVDPELYFPATTRGEPVWDLGYLGTYGDDRQPVLDRLMLQAAGSWAAGRFVVAGPQYPDGIRWPANVERIEHLPPTEHRAFYNSMRYTLNVTRRDMVRAGFSPSVRLFEAAACGVPIISDAWIGLDRFFTPAVEILIANGPRQTLRYLRDIPEADRREIGRRGRARVMGAHTAEHRAIELETCVREAGYPQADPARTSFKDGVETFLS